MHVAKIARSYSICTYYRCVRKVWCFVITCSGELCTEFPAGSGCSMRFSVLLSRLSSACDCSNTLSELLLRDCGWSSSPVERMAPFRSDRASDIRLQSMLFACSFRVAYSCRACSGLSQINKQINHLRRHKTELNTCMIHYGKHYHDII